MELDELKRLLEIDARGILSRRVEPLGTEYEIVLHELRLYKRLIIANREITLPGLERNTELIMKVLAEFKSKEKRNVMPIQFAKTDDIVIQPLRPGHFDLETFATSVSIPAGQNYATFHVIPQGASGNFNVSDKQIYVITDFIELTPEPAVTAIQVKNIDGVSQYPLEARLAFQATDMQIFELPHPVIADSTLDIDGRVEGEAGSTVDVNLVPIGVWIGYGKDVPSL